MDVIYESPKQNPTNPSKRWTDSDESIFARKLDDMLFLPGGANADNLQTPRVEKRSRLVGGFLCHFPFFLAVNSNVLDLLIVLVYLSFSFINREHLILPIVLVRYPARF